MQSKPGIWKEKARQVEIHRIIGLDEQGLAIISSEGSWNVAEDDLQAGDTD